MIDLLSYKKLEEFIDSKCIDGRYKARRRLRIYQSLIERDGVNCWLCQEEIDFSEDILLESFMMAANIPGKKADLWPSLDHVIEKRNGGSSKLENLKLSHRLCNSYRDVRFPLTVTSFTPDLKKFHERIGTFDWHDYLQEQRKIQIQQENNYRLNKNHMETEK